MKITVLLFLGFTLSCFARLGETEEQLAKRYGKATKAFGRVMEFSSSGYRIVVITTNHKATRISFEKEEKQWDKPAKIESEDIAKIMEANGRDRKWELLGKDDEKSVIVFLTTDKLMKATYDANARRLTLEVDEKRLEQKKTAPASTDGF